MLSINNEFALTMKCLQICMNTLDACRNYKYSWRHVKSGVFFKDWVASCMEGEMARIGFFPVEVTSGDLLRGEVMQRRLTIINPFTLAFWVHFEA